MDMLRRLLHKLFPRGAYVFEDSTNTTDAVNDHEFGGCSGAAAAVDLATSLPDVSPVPVRRVYNPPSSNATYALPCSVLSPVLPPSGHSLTTRLLDAQDPYYSINTSILDVSFVNQNADGCRSGHFETNWFKLDFLIENTDPFEESVIGVPVMLDPAVLTESQDIFS